MYAICPPSFRSENIISYFMKIVLCFVIPWVGVYWHLLHYSLMHDHEQKKNVFNSDEWAGLYISIYNMAMKYKPSCVWFLLQVRLSESGWNIMYCVKVTGNIMHYVTLDWNIMYYISVGWSIMYYISVGWNIMYYISVGWNIMYYISVGWNIMYYVSVWLKHNVLCLGWLKEFV